MFMIYTFCRSKLMYTKCIQNVSHIWQTFVYILYTKCLYAKCFPHFDKLLYTFCTQNLADIVLLILYTKYIQKLVKMWYTFCIGTFLYIFIATLVVYLHLVQFLYAKMYTQFLCGICYIFNSTHKISYIHLQCYKMNKWQDSICG